MTPRTSFCFRYRILAFPAQLGIWAGMFCLEAWNVIGLVPFAAFLMAQVAVIAVSAFWLVQMLRWRMLTSFVGLLETTSLIMAFASGALILFLSVAEPWEL